MKKSTQYKRPNIIPIDIILFHFSLIKIEQKVKSILTLAFVFIPGIIGILSSIDWVWFVSLFSFVFSCIEIYSQYLKNKNIFICHSPEFPNFFINIQPSVKETKAGYKIVPIRTQKDAILISDQVDQYLRKSINKIKLNLVDHKKNIIYSQQSRANFWKDILIQKHFEARQKKTMFFNEKKISLLTTINPKKLKVDVFESDYYLSYLTNDLCTLNAEDHSNEQEPDLLWQGASYFPCEELNAANNSSSIPRRMKTLESSLMSNHIGGNTLAFTNSGRLILWRQGKRAQRSVGLLAPTGSGSLNFEDYSRLENKNLGNLVITGMERELLEECHPSGSNIISSKDFIIVTKVIGFYRWIGKAGLPGFLGVTKLAVEIQDMAPNISEIDNPKHIKTDYPAENYEQLNSTLNELLSSPEKLSVPLCANLICLKNILHKEPQYLKFLFQINK